MADINDKKYQSCSDERLSKIIFTEGCLKSFNEEFWHPELKKYEDFRHERVLENLREGTKHHLKGNFSDMEYTDGDKNMWYNSYDCTHHQKSEEMYTMFVEEVHKHVVENIFPKLQVVADDNLLSVLANNWNTYKNTIHIFFKLFQHLTLWIEDVPEDETPKDGIEKIGLKEFKKEIVLQEEIKDKLTSILKHITDKHREGTNVNCEEIKTLCGMLFHMDCYKDVFEENFIKQTEEYYKEVAGRNFNDMTLHQYVLEVETLIASEKARTDSYGNEKTTDETRKKLQEVLISEPLHSIAHRQACGGVPRMLEDSLEDQLGDVFVTFKRVKGGYRVLLDCLCNYLSAEGKKVLDETSEKASAELQVNRLIELKKKCDSIVSNSFANNHTFELEVIDSFSKIVSNKNVSENLSIFLDMKKMKSIAGENEQEMDEICKKFMVIFRPINVSNKDAFKAAYLKHLCKRIAKVKSPFLAYDKKIVEQMKSVGAPAFTKEMEKIIKDFEESRVLNKSFLKAVKQDGFQSNFRVVNSRSWPPYKKLDANLIPSIVSDSLEKFKQFYHRDNQNKHKTLSVLNKNFVAEVSWNLPTKSYTLQLCSYYQIAVMELFNQKREFTFGELLKETKLSVKDLTDVLNSLTSKKYKILLKKSSEKTYSSADSFAVNEGLDHKSDKINVQMTSKSAA